MTYFRILGLCIICLFFSACEKQPEIINKQSEIKTAPEKAVQTNPVPALNLSVDNIPVEIQKNEKDIFKFDKEQTQAHSKVYKTLSETRTEPDTSFSGKIFTDQVKVDNKDYLDSLDGVQINVEGNF